MPLMDEFREERQAIRQKSLKEKLSYFFDYYKWHTVAVITLVAVVISLTVHLINRKDCALYVCLLNTAEIEQTEPYRQQFEEYAGIDRSEYEAVFDTSMFIQLGGRDQMTATSYQKMTVYTAAGDLDVLICAPDITEFYVGRGIFCDLRDILSPEQTALYESRFFYVDRPVLEEIQEARDKGEDYNPVFSDPGNPEAMEDPIPVGIRLDDCGRLKDSILFNDDTQVLSVISNSSRIDTALKFIDYVLQEP